MSTRSPAETFAYFVFATVPFWSLPLLPGTYRSPAPFLAAAVGLCGLAYAHRWTLHRAEHHLGAFAVLSALYSSALIIAGEGSTPHFVNGSATWIFGILSYIGFRILLSNMSARSAINIHINIARFILLFGCAEGSLKLLGFSSVFHLLSQLLSGKSSERLLITTSEPSWAIQVAIFYLPFLFANSPPERTKTDRLIMLLSPVLLLSSSSLTGMMVLLMAIFAFVFIDGRPTIIKRGGALLATIAALALTIGGIIMLSDGSAYYVSRLYKISDLEVGGKLFSSLLLVDDSLMIRLGYPYLALRVLIDHPLGVGIGQFGAVFPDYLQYLPAFGGFGEEVPEHLKNLNADTRNFYLKLLAENGILGSAFFATFLIQIRKDINNVDGFYVRRTLTLMLCAVLGMMMQFSTAYFACYWSFFALIQHLSHPQNEPSRGD